MKVDKYYEVLLDEYNEIRDEIKKRVEQIDKYTELSLLVIGAYVAYFNIISFNNRMVLVGFPIVLYALIFLTVRSDYMNLVSVKYINSHLKCELENIIEISNIKILQWEKFRYKYDLSNKRNVSILAVFLTGVRFGIPFLSIIMITYLYIYQFHEKFNKDDIFVLVFFIFGTILFLYVMITWIPYCSSIYANMANSIEGIYYIKSNNSNHVIDLYNADMNNGASIVIWEQNFTDAQKWKFIHIEKDIYSIISVCSKNALCSPYCQAGEKVLAFKYKNIQNMKWRVIQKPDNTCKIINIGSNLTLELLSNDRINGNIIQVNNDSVSAAQTFFLENAY